MLVVAVEAIQVRRVTRTLAGFTKSDFPAAADLFQDSRDGWSWCEVNGELAVGGDSTLHRESGYFLRK